MSSEDISEAKTFYSFIKHILFCSCPLIGQTDHVNYGFQIQRRFHRISFPSVPNDACSFSQSVKALLVPWLSARTADNDIEAK